MFEVLRHLTDRELAEAVYWLGWRLNARTTDSDAAFHRGLANDPGAEGAREPAVQEAIARVLEEIEAAEGAPIHALTDAQADPHLMRMYAVAREQRKPADPETTARALRILEEMRRDYGDAGRYTIA